MCTHLYTHTSTYKQNRIHASNEFRTSDFYHPMLKQSYYKGTVTTDCIISVSVDFLSRAVLAYIMRFPLLHSLSLVIHTTMTSLQTLIYAPRSIALFSTGVFTGLGFSMNLVSVPAIKASKDPLPSFVTTYNNASKVAMLNIFVGTAANAVCYYRTKNNKFLYASILTFFSFPFTLLMIAPVNNQLFAMQKLGDNYDRSKVQALINKWNCLQAFRTLTGTAAFVIGVFF